ncbi:retrovirus-related pol polyprotein from transposon TNT 1-94 [Tanacetum coccineum]
MVLFLTLFDSHVCDVKDAYGMIDNDLHESDVPSVSHTPRNTVVNNLLIAELATYKEQVELYERRARFELTEREQKIDEQLRIVICDRNIKEENLKKELHSVKLQLASTIQHNKLMVDEVTSLRKIYTVNMLENHLLSTSRVIHYGQIYHEDIQCAGSDTRPPMLDKADFVSWQQRIRLYCRGKDNGINILKSIDEGPFQMGTTRGIIDEGTEGSINMGHCNPKDTAMALTAYADADHAGCQDTRRSTSGSAQFLGDKLVSWSSKKQTSTSISSQKPNTSRCWSEYHWQIFSLRQLPNNYLNSFSQASMKCKKPETRKSLQMYRMSNGLAFKYPL